ncbi:hypothetical protein ONS96_013628 [Cadophora gregata f. sp. sojae]|nr:hypothetical protein ONS96_013628 [Cadophora gregata f. sp. sojae]
MWRTVARPPFSAKYFKAFCSSESFLLFPPTQQPPPTHSFAQLQRLAILFLCLHYAPWPLLLTSTLQVPDRIISTRHHVVTIPASNYN